MSTEAAVSETPESSKPTAGTTSKWASEHKHADEYMTTGRGDPSLRFDIETHGGEIESARDEAENPGAKEVEDLTESEYQKWKKTGDLPLRESKAAKAETDSSAKQTERDEDAILPDYERYGPKNAKW